jgi:hypothetical protein
MASSWQIFPIKILADYRACQTGRQIKVLP